MKLATLFIVSCGVMALPHMTQAQTAIFNFDSLTSSDLTNGTAPIGGNSLGNILPGGFINDTDGTVLAADQDTSHTTPPTTVTLHTTNTVNTTLFQANTSFQFLNNIQNGLPYGTNLNGNILENIDDLPGDVLHLDFNKPITSISLQFAIVPNEYDPSTGDPITGANGANTSSSLTLDGVSGGGTLNATSGDFEGNLLVTAASGSFTSVDLTYSLLGGLPISDDFGFAIDTITVTPATSAVPEPGTVALGAAGLITMASLLRRRRR
jgi:hypothetical protein